MAAAGLSAEAGGTAPAIRGEDFEFHGAKWGDAVRGGPGGVVTWAFDRTAGVLSMTETLYMNAVRQAFEAWETIARIDFREVGANAVASVTIAWESIDRRFGVVGQANWNYWDNGGYDTMIDATIVFDQADFDRDADSLAGSEFANVALHEAGHIVGLAHPPSAAQVMYAFSQPLFQLQDGDIAGAQSLYGAADAVEYSAAGGGGDDDLDYGWSANGYALDGKGGNDTLRGGRASDDILGGGGDDFVYCGAGNDTVVDGGGDDAHFGGAGNDSIEDMEGANLIDGGTGRDSMTGAAGSDTMIGGNGRDSIEAGGATDWVAGGIHADRIAGGRGDDVLAGEAGGDTFVFAPDDGYDRICPVSLSGAVPRILAGADFVTGEDRLLLDGFGYASAAEALGHVFENAQGFAVFQDQGTTVVLRYVSLAALTVDDILLG
jgi:Ca2+-binding RTX toxin-like protein